MFIYQINILQFNDLFNIILKGDSEMKNNNLHRRLFQSSHLSKFLILSILTFIFFSCDSSTSVDPYENQYSQKVVYRDQSLIIEFSVPYTTHVKLLIVKVPENPDEDYDNIDFLLSNYIKTGNGPAQTGIDGEMTAGNWTVRIDFNQGTLSQLPDGKYMYYLSIGPHIIWSFFYLITR